MGLPAQLMEQLLGRQTWATGGGLAIGAEEVHPCLGAILHRPGKEEVDLWGCSSLGISPPVVTTYLRSCVTAFLDLLQFLYLATLSHFGIFTLPVTSVWKSLPFFSYLGNCLFIFQMST